MDNGFEQGRRRCDENVENSPVLVTIRVQENRVLDLPYQTQEYLLRGVTSSNPIAFLASFA